MIRTQRHMLDHAAALLRSSAGDSPSSLRWRHVLRADIAWLLDEAARCGESPERIARLRAMLDGAP